ncbi:MAG TPA: TonB-dependent receptor [Steroidobacteraceae bacterium]|nr:TonB-dependent receptor [Steroidobacteraceae bacterium]
MKNRFALTHYFQARGSSQAARGHLPGSVALAVCAALCSPHGAQAQTAPQQSSGESAPALEEIVVTATRREENIQDVPVSITAFTQEQMDLQGVRQVDDIARLTPGLQFTRGNQGFGSSLSSSISIRGVSSTIGAATTGVYIDDTPIQVNSTTASGNYNDNAYPQLFDVERVEVLKGPQGTLFGSGSEGGTVRFITPSPNLNSASMYVRSEASYTQDGAPSYEVGVAGGMPIIEGVLGFRASVWNRHDGGWIDDVNYYTGQTTARNANYTDSTSARFALGWKPMDNLTITPSIFFQHVRANQSDFFYLHSDGVTSANPFGPGNLPTFVNTLGNPANGDYVNLHTTGQYQDQHLALPALKIDYAFDHAELLSNTSYFDRSETAITDYSSLEAGNWAGVLFPQNPNDVTPGYNDQANHYFTQEVRLQSTDNDARLKYVVGLYYSKNSTNAESKVYDPYMGTLISQGPLGPLVCGATAASCITNLFGVGLLNGQYSFFSNAGVYDTQKAAFGQVDFRIVENLIATVGLRYSKMTDEFHNLEGGPVTGVPGVVPESGSQSANATTPKYMLSYKTGDALVYASASKGFRNGGSNPPLNNAACQPDLERLGLASSPLTYKPDSVWSYELGTKFKTDQGRLQVDASVFQINWSNQIRNVDLVSCTLSFTSNLGKAQSRGADLSVNWRALDPLLLSLNAGYQFVKSTQDLPAYTTNGVTTYYATNGEALPGSQPTATLSGQYSFHAFGNPSYFRWDYTFTGRDAGQIYPPNVVGSALYPALEDFPNPGYSQTNVRLGTSLNNWDISLFVNNLFNAQPVLWETRGTVTFDAVPTGELVGTTLRPRTMGVTALYRF